MKLLIAGIVLLAIGINMIVLPKIIFTLTESWKSNVPDEPSSLYKIHIRIGGIACSFIGIVSIIAYIIF